MTGIVLLVVMLVIVVVGVLIAVTEVIIVVEVSVVVVVELGALVLMVRLADEDVIIAVVSFVLDVVYFAPVVVEACDNV